MATANSRLLDEKLGADREYWSKKLSGDLIVTGLPTDFKRPNIFPDKRARIDCEVEQETVEKLLSICGHAESLVFVALTAALNVCLYKYSGNEDIIVGTTIHGMHREVASLNKVLALRTHITGELTSGQLLQDIKRTLAEAYSHQKYSFDRILSLLGIEPSCNRAPLFDVAVLLDNINDPENIKHLKNDVTLIFSMSDGKIGAAMEFNPGLFNRKSLEIFWDHYSSALRAMLDSPRARVADIELLSAHKRREVIFDFNATQQDYPRRATIDQLFAEQAARTPQDAAVVFRGSTLSYSELNSRANQLAHRLRKSGVGPGVLVGLYLKHCPEMVVALLGVLKAGGAYVPLEPNHPQQRASFMLKDAGISIVLTERALEERLAGDGVMMLALDACRDELAQESEINPDAEATAEDLAYVIYTSGSTGEPKGVKIQHRALINYVWWAREAYLQGKPQGGQLSFALYSSLGFDLTVTSIYTPLITGNRVLIYRSEGKESPLAEILKDNQVDVLKLTPSHLVLIKEMDNRGSRIKRLIVGGEALQTELARQICERFGSGLEIFNEYGPTEATVGCMIYKFDPERDNRTSVPIGGPVANVEIYILGEDLNPLPENVAGELYISGEGLAQGYLNRPSLTAERFIDNPFISGQRMYKTGDVARWLGEGIEYLGRKDEQVKYHGYRVELNEIREALNRHPQIRDSVVMMLKDKYDQDVLVGYYASRNEIDAGNLRTLLSQSIIEETIPGIFIHLTKLPLTLNGKINYQALPTLADIRKQTKRSYVAPDNITQKVLTDIWAKLLDLEQVGTEDNFFELGGHSLLAAQVIVQIREALKIDIPLQSLFESPTPGGLAKKIDSINGQPIPLLCIEPVSHDGELPLSFAQQRFWFLNSLNPGNPAYNLRAPVRLTGHLNVVALAQSINEVVRRHEVLRCIFPASGGRPVQVILPAQAPTLLMADLSGLDETKADLQARRLLAEDALRRFDLSTGPLIRISIKQVSEREHVLQFTMHHIISDGWSIEVLNQEISSLYQSFSDGMPSALPELPIQYADFVAWQRQQLKGEMFDGQLAYWKRQLNGAAPVLGSLADRPRQKLHSYNGSTLPFKLKPHLAEGLRALSRHEGVTLFTTLLAVFQVLLHRYTGLDDIIVGTSVASRRQIETKGLIGCLINTVALRTEMSGNPTFRELLIRVRGVNNMAQANQDAPFELVIEALQPERRTNYTPFIQVWFALHQPVSAIDPPVGLRLTPAEVDLETAQFDLTLTMSEEAKEIIGRMNYSTELFDESTIVEMIGHYLILLEAVIANPEGRILDIAMVEEAM